MNLTFKVPVEHHPKTLSQLLRRAWLDATEEQLAKAFADGNVRINERLSKNPDKVPSPDEEVTAAVGAGEEPFGLPEAAELARGEGWVVVEKPVGMPGTLDRDDPMNSVLFLADTLGLDRDTFTPVWEMPAEGGGPWLFGDDPQNADELLEAWASGELMITWVVLTPTPGRAQGRIEAAHGIPIDYSATQIREGIAELQLTPMPQQAEFEDAPDPVELVLDALAKAQIPVLGDAQRGGYMIDGGLRLRVTALYQAGSDLAHSWNPDEDWWPTDPVVELPEEEEEEIPRKKSKRRKEEIEELLVSAKTIEVLTRHGHPWVLADRQTGSRGHLAPGSVVQLVGTDGATGPTALVEGTGKLAARVWSSDREAAEYFADEVDMRVDEAFTRRADLLGQTQKTDLFRLIHSEADGLPGLQLDRVGPLLRATLVGATAFGFRERVYQNILDFDPEMMILEVEHLRDIRTEEMPEARVVAKGASYVRPGERVVGVEDGLKYWCEPWEGIDVGFFADQRENRRRLRQMAEEGQKWLNLFCHTGAFTVALCSEGCEVVSNDLSQRYLTWLEENLDLNGLPQSLNRSVADDARAYLKRSDETFDGIIVDPPTAAAGSEGFWSVKKDYEDLLVDCFELLADNGVMLVCRNEKRASDPLEKLVRRAAKRAGRKVTSVEDAPPAPDYPTMEGFPEGDSFEGLWVRV
ncbi:class I SAM-dependent rRNA methyltransferase [Persicimonas caeni]|uniref:Class I SAM-dependent rRNA methyltransferase n=1 Tax=Persicimonas caeni TaxID=2292766 RepID=A0A4Y6PR40_PERCE|nr:class I SAM-dependent rRNA methyltransferase [Persicimonas caeni]QDG50794.1 class I SAM-dependent rRNA methyltransferase [Persicimonas caeni]QED32015.1 class I SAM-dependent rRNA methyltransferase [Persicimonas caeni]